MRPSIPIVVIIGILCPLVQESCASDEDGITPIDGTPGVWKNGFFYEDSDEDQYVDERIQRLLKLKRKNPCVTSSGLKGSCKRVNRCKKEGKMSWVDKGPDHCLIGGLHVGVCCPDELPTVPATEETFPTTPQNLQKFTSPHENPDSLPDNEPKACGLAPGFDGRITGGWRVSGEGRWPWIAALMKENGRKHFCGGTLITKNHVLTAAHCLENLKPNDITVRLGEFHLQEPSETEISVKVAEIINHEDYERITFTNDIAILVLKRNVKFKRGLISPACLPKMSLSDEEIENNDPLANRSAIATGWGRIYFNGPTSPVLLEVEVPIWNLKHCNDTYTQVIEPTVLCAGEEKGGKDSCSGDSGGPLVVNEGGSWSVIGIVSWGIGCGEPNAPGVYTRVSKYIPWILEKTT